MIFVRWYISKVKWHICVTYIFRPFSCKSDSSIKGLNMNMYNTFSLIHAFLFTFELSTDSSIGDLVTNSLTHSLTHSLNSPSKDIVSLNSKRGTIFRGKTNIFTPKNIISSLLSQKIVKYSISFSCFKYWIFKWNLRLNDRIFPHRVIRSPKKSS